MISVPIETKKKWSNTAPISLQLISLEAPLPSIMSVSPSLKVPTCLLEGVDLTLIFLLLAWEEHSFQHDEGTRTFLYSHFHCDEMGIAGSRSYIIRTITVSKQHTTPKHIMNARWTAENTVNLINKLLANMDKKKLNLWNTFSGIFVMHFNYRFKYKHLFI